MRQESRQQPFCSFDLCHPFTTSWARALGHFGFPSPTSPPPTNKHPHTAHPTLKPLKAPQTQLLGQSAKAKQTPTQNQLRLTTPSLGLTPTSPSRSCLSPSPFSSLLSPLSALLSPLASRLSLLAFRLSPLASVLSPLSPLSPLSFLLSPLHSLLSTLLVRVEIWMDQQGGFVQQRDFVAIEAAPELPILEPSSIPREKGPQ